MIAKNRTSTQLWTQLAALAASKAAVWGLLGDLSSKMPPGTRLDYAVEPPYTSVALDLVLGVGGLAVTVFLVVKVVRGHSDSRWQLPFFGALIAGALAGFFARILTAGGIGANIGAGMVVIIGLPLVGALLLAVVVGDLLLVRAARKVR